MTKVTPVKKIKLNKLPNKPTDLYLMTCGGYNEGSVLVDLLNSEGEELWEEDTFHMDAIYAGYTGVKRIGFDIRTFENCCGMYEVGGLTNGVLSDKDTDTIFTHMFEYLKGKGVIITTIQNQTPWETYLKKTKLFQAVKTFKNPGTANTITLWVSTN